ncbi:MAG: RNA polymerase subunit sigma-70 [Candidatus Lambdaproteobacteria bacterium]|nr:RNA polymerase subunit sigma-70 [Candidatus Lambdaproteobacteria bacterium]
MKGSGARGNGALSSNVKRLARLDLAGGGQVVVQGDYAYIGHMDPPHGTSIVDVSNPRKPRIVSQIMLPDRYSHSHKARVVGDLMLVNHEQYNGNLLRKGRELPAATARLEGRLGRAPSDEELAAALEVKPADVATLREANRRGYQEGGFKVYDVSDRTRPRLLCHQKTHGIGVHRFDCDEQYAYVSSEKEGYHGNVLRVYSLANPEQPEEVSCWALPGQHVASGERPTWSGYDHRLHHALHVGDRFYASCWFAGFAVVDASDIRRLRTLGSYNYHPPVHPPTHTVLPVLKPIAGRKLALVVDEEHDHHPGQLHASLWVFDIGDLNRIRPLSQFYVSEADSPWSRRGKRFGAHQFQEHIEGTLVFVTWFSGGLRIVDIADPMLPKEVGCFIPEPGQGQSVPQSNDVEVDGRGLIYLLDRLNGLDILEFGG